MQDGILTSYYSTCSRWCLAHSVAVDLHDHIFVQADRLAVARMAIEEMVDSARGQTRRHESESMST